MRAVVLVALIACTHAPEPPKVPPPPPPADARSIDARSPDAAIDAPVPVDAAVVQQEVEPPDALVVPVPGVVHSCPKHFADVAKTSCSLDDTYKLACKYPDGHCECVQQQPCAGWAGAYEEARKHPRAEWICTPKVRADGCPGDPPKPGSHCKKPGQECSFGSCGGQVMSCSGGAWKVTRVIGPPP